jgi:hypothetical protein
MAHGDGILSGPIDLDGPRRPRSSHPTLSATPGLAVIQRGTHLAGIVVGMANGAVLVRDRHGVEHRMALIRGGFEVDGRTVTLVEPRPGRPAGNVEVDALSGGTAVSNQRTPSGSVAVRGRPASVARASRILVEGVHDAELVEKVWGDDLRVEGVVVELLDGADHLAAVVRTFGPRPGRRLGVLLDHLVDGSKETRLASAIDHPDVLVTGHPYVDIWQAIKPSVLGVDAWPIIPPGRPWKEGVLTALGVHAEPGQFWRHLLGRVTTWTDLEPALIGAVEQLIDFVTEPS